MLFSFLFYALVVSFFPRQYNCTEEVVSFFIVSRSCTKIRKKIVSCSLSFFFSLLSCWYAHTDERGHGSFIRAYRCVKKSFLKNGFASQICRVVPQAAERQQ